MEKPAPATEGWPDGRGDPVIPEMRSTADGVYLRQRGPRFPPARHGLTGRRRAALSASYDKARRWVSQLD